MAPNILITSVAVKPMLARLVRVGERYGLEGCLTHPAYEDSLNQPMVEFYSYSGRGVRGDLGWEGNEGWHFVSRYYLDTFLGTCEWSRDGGPVKNGICLDGAFPEFNLRAETCQKVAAWIESLDQGEGNEAA